MKLWIIFVIFFLEFQLNFDLFVLRRYACFLVAEFFFSFCILWELNSSTTLSIFSLLFNCSSFISSSFLLISFCFWSIPSFCFLYDFNSSLVLSNWDQITFISSQTFWLFLSCSSFFLSCDLKTSSFWFLYDSNSLWIRDSFLFTSFNSEFNFLLISSCFYFISINFWNSREIL